MKYKQLKTVKKKSFTGCFSQYIKAYSGSSQGEGSVWRDSADDKHCKIPTKNSTRIHSNSCITRPGQLSHFFQNTKKILGIIMFFESSSRKIQLRNQRMATFVICIGHNIGLRASGLGGQIAERYGTWFCYVGDPNRRIVINNIVTNIKIL